MFCHVGPRRTRMKLKTAPQADSTQSTPAPLDPEILLGIRAAQPPRRDALSDKTRFPAPAQRCSAVPLYREEPSGPAPTLCHFSLSLPHLRGGLSLSSLAGWVPSARPPLPPRPPSPRPPPSRRLPASTFLPSSRFCPSCFPFGHLLTPPRTYS